MIQSFTDSSDILIAAAEKLSAQKSPFYVDRGPDQIREDDSISGADLRKAQEMILLTKMKIKDPGEKARIAAQEIDKAFAEAGARRLDLRVAMTVSSLNTLARLLNGVSGHKRLIWITGSLPITVRSDAGTGEAPELTREYGPKLQEAATKLADAGVSVYSLDARGLAVVGADASVSGSDVSDDLYRDRSAEAIRSSQATLRELSDETGGVAYVNGNDLASAVREALRPTAGFYRLTYQPANKNSDGQFRKIEVRVANFKNSQLQYRHGYKAEEEPRNNTEELQRRFLAALSTGYPPVGEIAFKATIRPQDGTSSAVDFVVDTDDLKLTDIAGCGKQLNVFSALFTHAIRYEWTDRNPIQKVRASSARLADPDVLSPDEFRCLLSHFEVREKAMVMLAGSTGLRRSEMFALRWTDVCFVTMQVHITKGVVRNRFGATKTPASRKPVPLHDSVATALLEWRSGSMYRDDDDFLFPSIRMNGSQPLFPDMVLKKFIRPAAKAAGLTKRLGWHTFRHSLATNLRSLGVDVKVAQELLRHANSRTTLDLYTRAVSFDKREANAKTMVLLMGESAPSSAPSAVAA